MSKPAQSSTAVDKMSSDKEGALDLMYSKVECMVSQLEKLRRTRSQILAVTRKLQDSLSVCKEGAHQGSKEEQVLRVISEAVESREEVLRELEEREVLLSHSVMNAVTSWTRGLADVKTDEEEDLQEDNGMEDMMVRAMLNCEPTEDKKSLS